MTDRAVPRLYALVAAVLVFFLAWAFIAAHPWSPAPRRAADPRVAALLERRQRIVRESAHVRAIVARRWARYRHALRARRAQLASIPAAPAARIVTLPPLVITRTS
jgi:hypothetical protein